MRRMIVLAALLTTTGRLSALSPPPDNSARAFAGEWAGTGEGGAYCFVRLAPDGSGSVLIDGGSGDWLGARLRWRNLGQSLKIEETLPLAATPRLRVLPLKTFELTSGFNQSLRLVFRSPTGLCHLQRTDAAQARLSSARAVADGTTGNTP